LSRYCRSLRWHRGLLLALGVVVLRALTTGDSDGSGDARQSRKDQGYTASQGYRAREFRNKTRPVLQSLGKACKGGVALQNIEELEQLQYGVLMLETSGRARLDTRQACAAESAARRSGLPVHVVFLTGRLHLVDNTTCQLARTVPNIHLYTVNLTRLATGSPLESFFSTSALIDSPFRVEHISDALRYLLLYKFGGFYLDLDMVVLGRLTHYRNSLVTEYCHDLQLSNGAMAFQPGHPFLSNLLHKVVPNYNPEFWTCIGPRLVTQCALEFTNTSHIEEILPSVQKTTSLNILAWESVTSLNTCNTTSGGFVAGTFDVLSVSALFPEHSTSSQQWTSLFQLATYVHFSSSASSKIVVTSEPEFSAYSHLGPLHCPVSFTADINF